MESHEIDEPLVTLLSTYVEQLDDPTVDIRRQAETQENIGRLLREHRDSAPGIMRLFRQRCENGTLSADTLELMQSMLERQNGAGAASRLTPAGGNGRADATDADDFGATTIAESQELMATESAEARVQVGSVLRDRYVLQERIYGGSMGVVYKALDRRLAETGAKHAWVAVKILAPKLATNADALRALQQEAAKGRHLLHPNIVRFIDLDRDDDLYFIVMEWLEGRTLAHILDSPGTAMLSKPEALRIVRQIGSALEYAHRRGIVHADVKPANVMIMPDGEAKLFDFGIARVRQKQLSLRPDFDPGVLGLLTPAYSSLQVLTGEEPVPADDVFSLGCLTYRLLAGYRVFGPRNAAEAAQAGMQPQPLDVLGEAQWRALKRALSYSRVARFETVHDFVAALDVDEEPGRAQPDEPGAGTRGGPRRAGIAMLVIVLLVAVLGFGANRLGYLDAVIEEWRGETQGPATQAAESELPALAAVMRAEAKEGAAADTTAHSLPREATETASSEAAARVVVDDGAPESPPGPAPAAEGLAAEAGPVVEAGNLSPATAVLHLGGTGKPPATVSVRLREDGGPATIDVVRSDATSSRSLRAEEIDFSGARPAIAAGEYTLSNNGYLEFRPGQQSARLTLAMTSDQRSEADQRSTLRIREVDGPRVELARIDVSLEDDDRRRFEARLPANTVAFGVSQVTVAESEAAVSIEVRRFQPDEASLAVAYAIRSVTALDGKDFVAPRRKVISFAPGQGSARLLVPLVQDAELESDETFVVELSNGDSTADRGVFRRIIVRIRDDEFTRR